MSSTMRPSRALLFTDDRHRVAIFRLVPRRAIERHLGGRLNHRDRRPQFVRGIGHELTLPSRKPVVEPIQQAIEGARELTELRRPAVGARKSPIG